MQGPARLTNLLRRQPNVALAGIAECTSRWELERQCNAVGAALLILEHARSDDQAPPGNQRLGTGKPCFRQPFGQQLAPNAEQASERFRRKALVRSGHHGQYGIARGRLEVAERLANGIGECSRSRLFDARQELGRTVVLLRYHQSIEAQSPHLEHVLRRSRRTCDVKHNGHRGIPALELPKRLEIGYARPGVVRVDHYRAHGARAA